MDMFLHVYIQLRETSTHDDPKRQDLFQRNLLLPGDLRHSIFCGHKHNNIQYIKTLEGCYVDIDMPSNSFGVRSSTYILLYADVLYAWECSASKYVL